MRSKFQRLFYHFVTVQDPNVEYEYYYEDDPSTVIQPSQIQASFRAAAVQAAAAQHPAQPARPAPLPQAAAPARPAVPQSAVPTRTAVPQSAVPSAPSVPQGGVPARNRFNESQFRPKTFRPIFILKFGTNFCI
jgi:hypothetical protein